jgi:hypothetical protein
MWAFEPTVHVCCSLGLVCTVASHTNFDPDDVSELGRDAAEERPVGGVDNLNEVAARRPGDLDDDLCVCRLW